MDNESSNNKIDIKEGVDTKTSPDELNYKYLIRYFEKLVRYTLTALGIIIVASGIFFYSNISDFKEDQLNRMDNIEKEASQRLQYIIDTIRLSAKSIAVKEAEIQVKNAFQENNISNLISEALRHKIGKVLTTMVNSELDNYKSEFRLQFESMSRIFDLVIKARNGYRSSYEELIKVSKNENEDFNSIAAEYVKKIKTDYSEAYKTYPKYYSSRWQALSSEGWSIVELTDSTDIGALIHQVAVQNDLAFIAMIFFYINEQTKQNIELFDFTALNNWWMHNKEKYIKSNKVKK